MRLLVIGASGSGSSTLGRGLAGVLASQHFEVDDFFWEPTDPPFRIRRMPEERVSLMQAMMLPRADWVLSGSPLGWGDGAVVPRLTHAIFVTLDPRVRLARLARRERVRYGTRIDPGGDQACAYRGFMDWAAGYDRPDFPQRSRAGHERWLESLPCPVLTLDAGAAPDTVLARALDWLSSGSVPAARTPAALTTLARS